MLTCHPDKFKTRMFPSKIVNLSLFLSSALGQLWVGPLSRLAATASRLLALSVTAAAVPAPPRGEPSRCATKSLRKTKSRLPLWGRWTRVSEDGEGKLPAAPSHGLCGSAGGLPSQSPSGDSSPEGRAKSRLPLWGRCHAFGMTERARRWLAPQLSGSRLLGALPAGKNASLFP